ncbi:Olfactory receptor 5B3 [Sciurus carolinensis]|uniref:Olfactory receptor 5B3 n=1 Tax=Sciurus carolinensis TaxID=30640 RepID=A0AA41MFE5_SCICA|nr:Olfactory receptor 5B3 [Sciurus carolinensis]
MTTRVCTWLIIGCYVIGFINASIHTGNAFSLVFCLSNVVHHFFCDVPALIVLSCSDRQVNELVLIHVASFNIFFALFIILISYIFIFITVLKMRSGAGHRKTLATCASHFSAVSVYYGTTIFMYLQSISSHSIDTDKIASVFYTMVIPVLKPVQPKEQGGQECIRKIQGVHLL